MDWLKKKNPKLYNIITNDDLKRSTSKYRIYKVFKNGKTRRLKHPEFYDYDTFVKYCKTKKYIKRKDLLFERDWLEKDGSIKSEEIKF